MSKETSQILKQIGQTICELRLKEDEDRYSVSSSQSHRSVPKSHKSIKAFEKD
jgi:hypothetical protein